MPQFDSADYVKVEVKDELEAVGEWSGCGSVQLSARKRAREGEWRVQSPTGSYLWLSVRRHRHWHHVADELPPINRPRSQQPSLHASE